MAVSRKQKSEILNTLIKKIKEAKSIGFTQTNGLTVSEFSSFKNTIRTTGTTYTVAKKTLIKIAIKDALDLDMDLDLLPGQIGLICSNEDSIAGLGKTNDFIKSIYSKKSKIQKIEWIASIFEGEIKNKEETKVIAGIPSKETLLGRLVGSMQSPISALARFFDSASKDIESKGVSKIGDLKIEKKEEIKEEKEIEVKEEENTK